MTLGDDNARFTVLKAIADSVTDEMKRLRGEHFTKLYARYSDDKSKKWAVTLPGDDVVIAEVTIPVPERKAEVSDPAALDAWIRANHREILTEIPIPAQPAIQLAEWLAARHPQVAEQLAELGLPDVMLPEQPQRVEQSIDWKRWAEIAKQFKLIDATVLDTTLGQFVDGMHVPKPNEPKSFTVTWKDGGQELALDAYRGGQLNELVNGASFVQAIEAAPEPVERHLNVVPADDVDDRHMYDLKTHYPPRAHPHPLTECTDRKCPAPGYDEPWMLPPAEARHASGWAQYCDEPDCRQCKAKRAGTWVAPEPAPAPVPPPLHEDPWADPDVRAAAAAEVNLAEGSEDAPGWVDTDYEPTGEPDPWAEVREDLVRNSQPQPAGEAFDPGTWGSVTRRPGAGGWE